ncbi:hypothetical protein QQF64_012987 [Cirrhinus molitorella]|uniref:Uncharacterized protein n=1 Tax=Cirrhinus molitorella TaxID=172907 RepID=A0ABR3LS53_9TELE
MTVRIMRMMISSSNEILQHDNPAQMRSGVEETSGGPVSARAREHVLRPSEEERRGASVIRVFAGPITESLFRGSTGERERENSGLVPLLVINTTTGQKHQLNTGSKSQKPN